MIPHTLKRFALSRLRAMVIVLVSCLGVPAFAADETRPNVVLILIDDLGWADLELTGSTFHETPRMNQLAREGVFFSNAYAANPVCSPTRASILTGKVPSRIGVTNHGGTPGPRGPAYRLTSPDVAGNLPPEDLTMAEAFHAAGYRTAHIGKWHLQAHYEKGNANFPEAHGFELNIAGHAIGQPGAYYFPYESEAHPSTNVPDLEDGQEGDYLTDVLTDKAIEYMEAHREEPFFLNLWYYTVHTLIDPRKDLLEKFNHKAQSLWGANRPDQGVPEYRGFFSRTLQDKPDYAAMVAAMDENVGRILDALDRLGLADNTVVVFFSDNGGLSTGPRLGYPTSNLPLRAGKAWLYEGGIRVPFLIRYPGTVPAGVTLDTPVMSTDVYPTLLALAGMPLKPDQHVDGVNLAPLMRGEQAQLDREALYFHYPHYHPINSKGPSGAIRMGDYKLHESFETGQTELYNLRTDPGETHDLSAEQPERARDMLERLHAWQRETGAAMPVENPAYDPANDWRPPVSKQGVKK